MDRLNTSWHSLSGDTWGGQWVDGVKNFAQSIDCAGRRNHLGVLSAIVAAIIRLVGGIFAVPIIFVSTFQILASPDHFSRSSDSPIEMIVKNLLLSTIGAHLTIVGMALNKINTDKDETLAQFPKNLYLGSDCRVALPLLSDCRVALNLLNEGAYLSSDGACTLWRNLLDINQFYLDVADHQNWIQSLFSKIMERKILMPNDYESGGNKNTPSRYSAAKGNCEQLTHLLTVGADFTLPLGGTLPYDGEYITNIFQVAVFHGNKSTANFLFDYFSQREISCTLPQSIDNQKKLISKQVKNKEAGIIAFLIKKQLINHSLYTENLGGSNLHLSLLEECVRLELPNYPNSSLKDFNLFPLVRLMAAQRVDFSSVQKLIPSFTYPGCNKNRWIKNALTAVETDLKFGYIEMLGEMGAKLSEEDWGEIGSGWYIHGLQVPHGKVALQKGINKREHYFKEMLLPHLRAALEDSIAPKVLIDLIFQYCDADVHEKDAATVSVRTLIAPPLEESIAL